jgi:hypothetical protein
VIPEEEVAKKAARWRTRSGGRLRLSGTGPIGTAPGLVAGVFSAQGAVRLDHVSDGLPHDLSPAISFARDCDPNLAKG